MTGPNVEHIDTILSIVMLDCITTTITMIITTIVMVIDCMCGCIAIVAE